MPTMPKYEKNTVYVGDWFAYGPYTLEVTHVIDKPKPAWHTDIVFLRVGENPASDGSRKLIGGPYFIPFDELESQGFIGPLDEDFYVSMKEGIQRILREGHGKGHPWTKEKQVGR